MSRQAWSACTLAWLVMTVTSGFTKQALDHALHNYTCQICKAKVESLNTEINEIHNCETYTSVANYETGEWNVSQVNWLPL